MRYIKKPDEVDAIKFERVGNEAVSNGRDLVNWVLNNGGTAVWLDKQDPVIDAQGAVIPGREEMLQIFTQNGGASIANLGDYVVKTDSDFKVFKASEFERKYEQA